MTDERGTEATEPEPPSESVLERRLRLAHQARRAKEHELDGIRRALCDAGFMEDDDPFGHADLAEVIRQAGELFRKHAAKTRDFCSPHGAVDSDVKAKALTASPEAWARLGRALRERREAMGLSRRALSEKADVSESSIQNAEDGRVPSKRWPQSIARIARTLGWEPAAALEMVLVEYNPMEADQLVQAMEQAKGGE